MDKTKKENSASTGGLLTFFRRTCSLKRKKRQRSGNSEGSHDNHEYPGINIDRSGGSSSNLQIPGLHLIRLTDCFLSYERKPDNASRRYGLGAVIVVPLFTDDLIGYKVDMRRIKEFFERKLYYKYYQTEENCTKEVLMQSLHDIRDEIQESHLDFDRLVCVVLSHGEEAGIQTCGREHPEDPETALVKTVVIEGGEAKIVEKEENVITTIEEITSLFKHTDGNLPKLKGMPKLFVIQACRGTEIVKAAGGGPSSMVDGTRTGIGSRLVPPVADLPLKVTIPDDADMEVCYASTPQKFSFVDDYRGSWLVQTMLTTFEDHMTDRHVSEMLTTVTFAVSEHRQKSNQGLAVQIPSVVSTLRKQFWLDHGREVDDNVPSQPADGNLYLKPSLSVSPVSGSTLRMTRTTPSPLAVQQSQNVFMY